MLYQIIFLEEKHEKFSGEQCDTSKAAFDPWWAIWEFMLKISVKQSKDKPLKGEIWGGVNVITGKGGQEADSHWKYSENDTIHYLVYTTTLQSPICSIDTNHKVLSCEPSWE